jgi:hypothetical protein
MGNGISGTLTKWKSMISTMRRQDRINAKLTRSSMPGTIDLIQASVQHVTLDMIIASGALADQLDNDSGNNERERKFLRFRYSRAPSPLTQKRLEWMRPAICRTSLRQW